MTITHLITADELEAMGSDARFELIQGVLHEMSPSHTDPSVIAMRLGIRLGAYILDNDLGILSGEGGGYLLERNPDTVVAPDLGFVRRQRLILWPERKGFFPEGPDLAVEVKSATDEAFDVRRKQMLYERVGIPMVWWIDSQRRVATVHTFGERVRHLTETDFLEGESIVPGFSIQLAEIFDF